MSAEVEAAEMLIRIIGAGTSEVIRISWQITQGVGRNLIPALAMQLYAMKHKSANKYITRNPAGQLHYSIPTESFETFKKIAKEFKLPFYAVNLKDYNEGFTEIGIRAEDSYSAKHIFDAMGITSVIKNSGIKIEKISANANEIINCSTKEEALLKLKDYTSAFSESLDRKTNKDFSRDEPYYLVSAENPKNYISIKPELASFNGSQYTKSTYEVYNDGEKVLTVDDSRFEGREKDYWKGIKDRISKAGNFQNNNMIYLRDKDSLISFQAISSGENPIKEINIEKAKEEISEIIPEKVIGETILNSFPEEAQIERKRGLESGLKNGNIITDKSSIKGEFFENVIDDKNSSLQKEGLKAGIERIEKEMQKHKIKSKKARRKKN